MCLLICRCRWSSQHSRRSFSSSLLCRRCLRIAVACCICCYIAVFVARHSRRCLCRSLSLSLWHRRCSAVACRLVRRSSLRCCCIRCYFAIVRCLVCRSIVGVFVALSRKSSRCTSSLSSSLIVFCSTAAIASIASLFRRRRGCPRLCRHRCEVLCSRCRRRRCWDYDNA